MSINCVNPLLNKHFTIGEWQVEPLSGCFKQADKSVHVEPKIMDVLLCLADKPGEILSRDELLCRVWNGVGVSDEVLTRAISELRTLLGDTDREKRYIRTIPKRGYSLITEVICIDKDQACQSRDSSTTTHNTQQSSAGEEADTPHESPPVREEDYKIQAKLQKTSEERNNNKSKTFSNVFISFLSHIIGKAVISTLLIVFGLLISPKLISLFHTSKSQAVKTDTLETGNNNSAASSSNNKTTDYQSEPNQSPGNNKQSDYRTPDWLGSNKIKTIAVLPMVNLSADSRYAYFADGLSEDIRNALIGMPGIKVVARTSSRVFKDRALDIREIGKQLNADALIEGTIRVRDGRVRVTTQLTNAHNGYPFWASSFDKDISDVFAIQYEIAQEVANKLKLELQTIPKSNSPVNPVAYEKYLWGRSQWHQRTKNSIETAIQYFSEAIEEDPAFALAYSGLADAYSLSISYAKMPMEKAVPLARQYAQKALALDKNLAEAHASIGTVYMIEHKLKEARQAYEKAIELKPTYSMARMWLGNILLQQHEVTLAYEQYKQALDNDPLHPQVQSNYLHAMMMMGRYSDAIVLAEQYYQLSHNEDFLKIPLEAYGNTGRYDLQLEFLLQNQFTNKKLQKHAIKQLILALARLDRIDEAMQIFNDNRESFNPWKRTSLALQLAVANNNSHDVLTLAGELDTLPVPMDWEPKGDCMSGKPAPKATVMYWRGMGHYMKNDFVAAEKYFANAIEQTKTDCWTDYGLKSTTAIYQADVASLLKDNASETILLQAISQRIKEYKHQGWGMMFQKQEELAYNLLSGNHRETERLIATFETDAYEPWGTISDDPLFRRHLKNEQTHKLFKPLQLRFLDQQQHGQEQDLAKFH